MPLILELQAEYENAKTDPELLGRDAPPSGPITWAAPRRSISPSGLTDRLGGAKVYMKRDELNHTGAHKINNVLGQIILARRMGKKRIIAETGAGQHGVATATVCAKFGLKCRWSTWALTTWSGRRPTCSAMKAPRCRGRAGDLGPRHAEGCDERRSARLGDQCAGHVSTASAPLRGRIPTRRWCANSSRSSARRRASR